MKNKFYILLVFIIVLSTVFVGCGAEEKVNELMEQDNESSDTDKNIESEHVEQSDGEFDGIKEQAKKEGVSASELEKTLEGLAEIGAEKYGISVEEYISQIESSGNSLLSQWQQASEVMGISITELYEYEKNSLANMSDEQKEIMQGMGNALEMAQEELANVPDIGTTDAGKIMGIEENATGETNIVKMTEEDLREELTYETYKILQDYTDEYSTLYEYVTDAEYEDVVAHYVDLIVNTEEYLKIEPMGSLGVMLQGTVNETMLYIEIDNSDPGKVRISTYLDLTTKK